MVIVIAGKVATASEVGVTGEGDRKDLGEEEETGRMARTKIWGMKGTTALLQVGKSATEALLKTRVLNFIVQVGGVVSGVDEAVVGDIAGEEDQVAEEVLVEGREMKVLIGVAFIGKPPLLKVYSGKLRLRRTYNGRLLLSRTCDGRLHRVTRDLIKATRTCHIRLAATICKIQKRLKD